MWAEYGLDWWDALRVVLSCIAFYVVILLLVRGIGQRTLASLSSFDLAALIALGAIVGRAILGSTPTLFSGLLGLATLIGLQALTGQLRRLHGASRLINSPPIVLMAGEHLLPRNLARSHVVESEVYSKLRLAGIRNFHEVGCVVLEPTGQISVLRRGEPIDPELVRRAIGADRIPAEILAGH